MILFFGAGIGRAKAQQFTALDSDGQFLVGVGFHHTVFALERYGNIDDLANCGRDLFGLCICS